MEEGVAQEKRKYRAFPSKIKILNKLIEGPKTVKDLLKVREYLGIRGTQLRLCLKDLQSVGWVISKKEGKAEIYSVTSLGRAVRDLLEEAQSTVILDDGICKYLAGKLLAPGIEADKWESPSAIFMRVENKYEIDDKGHLFADLYLELIQLQPKQGISTPIICDPRDEPTITWNMRELSPNEFARCEVGTSELFSSKDIKSCLFYAYSLPKPTPGKLNKLNMRYDSRLIICELSRSRFGFCLPVFYGIKGAKITIDLTRASNCIEEIEAKRFIWKLTEKGQIWGESSKNVNIEIEVDKKSQKVNKITITFFYEAALDEWDEYIILKRFVPDLLHVSFKTENEEFKRGCTILSENFKKPFIYTKGEHLSLSYFCGGRLCKPPTQI